MVKFGSLLAPARQISRLSATSGRIAAIFEPSKMVLGAWQAP
jgi:hypothetical protein